jgi:hypothetical protein
LDKTIVTALFLIAGVVCVVVMFNALYPAVVQSSDAMVGMERRVGERLDSQITIVHVAPSDVYGNVALAWVKNVGNVSIKALDRCDVFFGPEADFARIPYGAGSPHWTYTVENDAFWNPTATVKLSIEVPYNLQSGTRYFVKMVLPNGVAAEYFFTK